MFFSRVPRKLRTSQSVIQNNFKAFSFGGHTWLMKTINANLLRFSALMSQGTEDAEKE
jgi:hypothetical protein